MALQRSGPGNRLHDTICQTFKFDASIKRPDAIIKCFSNMSSGLDEPYTKNEQLLPGQQPDVITIDTLNSSLQNLVTVLSADFNEKLLINLQFL